LLIAVGFVKTVFHHCQQVRSEEALRIINNIGVNDF